MRVPDRGQASWRFGSVAERLHHFTPGVWAKSC